MPVGADKNMIRPTRSFKKSIYKVITAIVMFVLAYLILVLLSIAISAAFVLIGGWLVVSVHQIAAIILGAGFVAAGFMFVFFLFKFFFVKGQKFNKGHEITETEQPELFAFIKKVTGEVGTKPPKKVYLTPEVNASASFRSVFWSMFFPTGKDLTIGLGLVNSLNQSEFKTVLAHEFGHFSQRSMRFGSYVYHLNRALYNLLYENNGYHRALNSVARIHSYLRLPIMLIVYLIRGIQAILQKMYVFINKSHMQLSRQMEFHADTIAAYTSGSNNVITSLRKLEVSDTCYNQALNELDQIIADDKRTANVYKLHLWFLKRYAHDNNLDKDNNGLPLMNEQIAQLQYIKIKIDNPWLSHPALADREENANIYNLNPTIIYTPAWDLFNDAEKLQEMFTDQLYQNANLKKMPEIVSNEEIEAKYLSDNYKDSQNKVYKGFYDNRFITSFNLEEAILSKNENVPFSQLITDDTCNLQKMINSLNNDIARLGAFEHADNGIKSFDYMGVKHYAGDAELIKGYLGNEIKEKEKQIADLDQAVFLSFYHSASTDDQKKELLNRYESLFKYQADSETDYKNYNDAMTTMAPTKGRMKYSDIYKVMDNIYYIERTIKPRIKQVIEEEHTKPFVLPEQLEALNKYLTAKLSYFIEPNYDNNALNIFYIAMNAYINIIWKRNFSLTRELLDFQLTLNPQ
jgi:Zn-dependent protease with chaperone function